MAATIAEAFDPSAFAATGPPYYLRMLSRRKHWRGSGGDLTLRAKQAVDEVFRNDSGRVSVFRAETAEDVARIAVGLNSTRMNQFEEIELLGFTDHELEKAGLQIQASPGDTRCLHANRLHYDILHDPIGIRRLVDEMIHLDRLDIRYKR